MMIQHMMNCIDEIYVEVNKSSSPEIQDLIGQINQKLPSTDREMMIKKMIMLSLTFCLSQGILDDDFFEATMIDNLKFLLKKIPYLKCGMLLKVELRGLEKEMNRFIKVPYDILLSDLCYLILAGFHADGNHLFTITLDGQGRFGCDQCDMEYVDGYAADITLSELSVGQGTQMQLCYDFGENYIFDIEVVEVCEFEHVQTLDDVRMEDGCGYGIWEDSHSLLETYYLHHNDFLQFIEEYGLSEDDFIFEEFDRDLYNEMILEDFEYLKKTYELSEDFE